MTHDMKTEQEIQERINHIKTLGKGYGINDKRIKELEWVLKPSKVKNNVDLHSVVGRSEKYFCEHEEVGYNKRCKQQCSDCNWIENL